MKIAGHKKQIEFLTKSIETGTLAHAYVFAGPAFVGKRSVALEFAKKLLEGDQSRETPAGTEYFHADFLEIKGEAGIKIEEIRELVYKLSLKPYQAQYKIALIDNADTMTVEAQNALLKNLEEPKSYTVIILITSNPGKLLRTITSRAQKINFGPVETSEYENLIPQNLDSETRELILTMAAGRPGLALLIASDESLVDKLKQINSDFKILQSSDLAEKLKLAYDLADLESADIKQTLDFWLIKFDNELKQSPSLNLARNLAQINSARKFLDQNLNSKLLLTNLMLNLV